MQLQLFFLALFYFVRVEATVSSFVYSNAPQNLIEEARKVGKQEREVFDGEIAKLTGQDGVEHETELYSKHLMACSSVGLTLTERLQKAVGDEAEPNLDENKAKARGILKSVGFDDIASRIFTFTTSEIKEIIKTACLKHELQFQCADSFVNDRQKIMENINKMKSVDGNIKVMFEKECNANEAINIPRIYSCIGDAASEIEASCTGYLMALNRSESSLNSRIHNVYQDTIDKIINSEETQKTNLAKIKTAMHEIRRLEAFQCRIFKQVEECAVNTIAELCGENTRDVTGTLLRVGRLRRQRGDFIHDHFVELNISEHKHCSRYA